MTNDTAGKEKSDDYRRGEYVQSLERGLAVIRVLAASQLPLTVTEVAQATGFTRATARRFLLTLTQLQYVRSEGNSFSLRPRVLELGHAYLSELTIPQVARPVMEELVRQARETSSLAVLDGQEIVYVANVSSRRVLTINVSIGHRDPAYCTSLGHVLLASLTDAQIECYLQNVDLRPYTEATVTNPEKLWAILRQVRQDGYALIQDQFENGLLAIAVPVHGPSGDVVAAMNISAYSLRVGPATLVNDYLPLLQQTAHTIEQELQAGSSVNRS